MYKTIKVLLWPMFDSCCLAARNMSKLLSGRELVENGGKKIGATLPACSTKQIIPSGVWLEKKQIENGIDVRRTLIADQRIEKKHVLSQAEWDEHTQRALVLEKKGNFWSYIGYTERSITYIYPEEALHLMEINALLLRYGGVAISIQQAYSLLIGKSISLDEYRVYSSLMREGYRLLRHEYSDLFSNELNGNFESNVTKESDSVPESIIEEVCNEQSDSVHELVIKSNDNIDQNKENDSSMIISDDSSNDCMLVAEDDSNSSKKRKATDRLNVQNKKFASQQNVDSQSSKNKLQILNKLVNCIQKKVVHVSAPDEKYIPSDIKLSKRNYFINLSQLSKKNSDSEANPQPSFTSELPVDRFRFNNPRIHHNQFSMNNLYMNNSYFFNHIFHQISSQSNMMFSRYSCTSQFHNMVFGKRGFQCNNSVKCHPPPFLSNRRAMPNNRYNHRYHNYQSRTPALQSNNNIETVDLSDASESKYIKLLSKIKNIVTNKDGQISVNDMEKLDSIVKEYNLLFNEDYTVTKETRSEIESERVEKVVQLSSDSSDSYNELPSTSSNQQNRKTNEPVPCSSTQIQIESVAEGNTNDQRAKLFSNWLSNGTWNKPEVSFLKAKRNSQILKLCRAFLNTAKKFSFDDENGILSWKEARDFYERMNTQNTVSISDDDEENTESGEMNCTIKVKNVHPLIRPQDCLSVSTVLERLQLIKSCNDIRLSDEEKLKISFDMFKPNVKAIKRTLPSHCLVVRNINSAVPDSRALAELRSKIPESVVILFAIVSVDSVLYLQMENVQLPTMVEDIES